MQPFTVLLPLVGWTAVIAVSLVFMVKVFAETPWVESRCVVALVNATGVIYVLMAAGLVHTTLGAVVPALAGNVLYSSVGWIIGLLLIAAIIAFLVILYAQNAAKAKAKAKKAAGNAAKAAAEADPTKALEEFLAKATAGNLKEKDIIDTVTKFDPDGQGDSEKLWEWLKGNDLSGISCKIGKALLPKLEDMKKTGKADGQALSKEDLAEVQKMIDFIKKHCPSEESPAGGDDDHH